MEKNRKSKIGRVLIVIALIAISVLLIVFVQRQRDRMFVTASVDSVEVVAVDNATLNHVWDTGIREKIANESSEYVFLEYRILISNFSDEYLVQNIKIEPEYNEEISKQIVWFDTTDAITDNQMIVKEGKQKYFLRRLLVEKNDLSDQDIARLAMKEGFEVSYQTIKGTSSLSLGWGKISTNSDVK